jgi:DNA-binding HxlR family transcriptional regulator
MSKTTTPTCTVETANVRDVLDAVADKWTLVVLDELEERTMRFSELQRAVGGISQKVLTQTLRDMERNGFVTRVVHPEVPPRVEYALTPMGLALGEAMCALWKWTGANYAKVLAMRERFDGEKAARAG